MIGIPHDLKKRNNFNLKNAIISLISDGQYPLSQTQKSNSSGLKRFNKNNIMGLSIIVIIILLVGSSIVFDNNGDYVKVGSSNFEVPDGFTSIENYKYFNITNGLDSICIYNRVRENLNETIQSYIDDREQNGNVTVQISNFTVDDIIVYKADILNDNKRVQYWFEDGGKVYNLFTWNKNQNTDSLVSGLIKNRSFS